MPAHPVFFRQPVFWRDIQRGFGIQAVYVVVFLAAAAVLAYGAASLVNRLLRASGSFLLHPVGYKLAPLHINLFIEASPAPIKYALSLIGKCANMLRLPMVPASERAQVAVRQAMVHAGLTN